LSVCPNCGAKLAELQVRSIPAAENKKAAGSIQSAFRLIVCPSCGTKFPSRVAVDMQSATTANVKNAAERIRGVRDEFMATLKVLREKIQALEAEKAELMVEVEKLRKAAELRANALEGEVAQMREEAKSLKQLLGTAVAEKQVPPPPQKPAST